jgi:hypothetical protein
MKFGIASIDDDIVVVQDLSEMLYGFFGGVA